MEPCAVVASACESILPLTIIKGIFGVDSLPTPNDVLESIKAYPYQISTKYYDASIRLCTMHGKTIGNQEFAERVGAVVLCFDSHSASGLSEAESWLPFLDEFNTDVKILVCDYCHESANPNSACFGPGIDRVTAVKWCIKNGFELVELNPQVDYSDDDLEDDFPETVGVSRIIEALGSHLWPNMIRKGPIRNSNISSLTENKKENDETNNPKPSEEHANGAAGNPSGEDDDGMFEALFQQLSTMKSKASSIHNREDRKEYAEKMAVAFWKALGGDEAEVEELNNDIPGEESS